MMKLPRSGGAALLRASILVMAAAAAAGAAVSTSPEILFQRGQLERSLEQRLHEALSSYLGVPNVVAVVNVGLLVEEARHGNGEQKDSKGVEYVLPGVPVDQELTKKKGVDFIRSSDRVVRATIYIGKAVDPERLEQAKVIAGQILELDASKGDAVEVKVFQPSAEAKEVKEARAETRRDVLSYTGAAAVAVGMIGILALSFFLYGPLRSALASITEALGKRGAGGGGGGGPATVAMGPAGAVEQRGGGARSAGGGADEDQLFAFIDEESVEGLVQALTRENEVLISSVLECLPRPLAAKAFTLFPPDKRLSILQQARTVRYANPESIKMIEKQIRSKLGFSFGGVRRMSRIIQRAGRASRAAIVEDLRATDPELAAHLRSNLIEFEDLAGYEDKAIARLFREVGMVSFARCLKAADPALTERISAKLPAETAEMLREQVSFLPPVSPEAAEEEFLKVVEVVERLKSAGVITSSDVKAVEAQG